MGKELLVTPEGVSRQHSTGHYQCPFTGEIFLSFDPIVSAVVVAHARVYFSTPSIQFIRKTGRNQLTSFPSKTPLMIVQRRSDGSMTCNVNSERNYHLVPYLSLIV